MLLILRDGDSYGDYINSLLCIPICQWEMEGHGLRFFAIVPQQYEGSLFCDVHIGIEETCSWLVVGKDKEFNTNPFDENDLPKISDQIDADLYYVWDAEDPQMKRACRLYDTFLPIIKKHEAEAQRVWKKAADAVYAEDIKNAKERGFSTLAIQKPSNDHGYGWFPQETVGALPK